MSGQRRRYGSRHVLVLHLKSGGGAVFLHAQNAGRLTGVQSGLQFSAAA